MALIAGPCALESRDHALDIAGALKEIASRLGIGIVFKTSFDKANRTSAAARAASGLTRHCRYSRKFVASSGCRSSPMSMRAEQCAELAAVVDVLQIPAFLCRQTDLLIAAARTGRVVNVKKGQFLAPWDMAHVVAKITGAGNRNVLVTERGASFGYNTLVSDMRALPILARSTGAPVDLRRHPLGAAARRARHHIGRRARIRRRAGARRGRGRRRGRVHRNP